MVIVADFNKRRGIGFIVTNFDIYREIKSASESRIEE